MTTKPIITASYGEWESPISAESLVTSTILFNEVEVNVCHLLIFCVLSAFGRLIN